LKKTPLSSIEKENNSVTKLKLKKWKKKYGATTFSTMTPSIMTLSKKALRKWHSE
jgi:hypothetical protein